MSGHSKWSTIKRKKEKTDSQKSKLFAKISKELIVCVKEGGDDTLNNSKLRDLILKAKQNNIPNDNINRIIQKSKKNSDKDNYEKIVYEGYGPNGVAIIVNCLTDNKNRTAGNIRHYFDKFGGNLGSTGCVSFMFSEKGIIIIENQFCNEEQVLELCYSINAEDFQIFDDVVEIEFNKNQLDNSCKIISKSGFTILKSEIQNVPSSFVNIQIEDSKIKLVKLLEHLEEDDDVIDVFNNIENLDELYGG